MRFLITTLLVLVATLSGCGGGEDEPKELSEARKAPKRSELAKKKSVNEDLIKFHENVFFGLTYIGEGSNDLENPAVWAHCSASENHIKSKNVQEGERLIAYQGNKCEAILKSVGGKILYVLAEYPKPITPGIENKIAGANYESPQELKDLLGDMINHPAGGSPTNVVILEYTMTTGTPSKPESASYFELIKTN
jgi:hypothetical protein